MSPHWPWASKSWKGKESRGVLRHQFNWMKLFWKCRWLLQACLRSIPRECVLEVQLWGDRGLWFKKKLFGDKSNTKLNMHCIIYCFKSFSGQGGLGENVSSVPSWCHSWEDSQGRSRYFTVAKTSKIFSKRWKAVMPLNLLWLQYISMFIFGYYM